MKDYSPKQGDIIVMDFNPSKGREQQGKRPALIINNEKYFNRTGLIIVSPISSTQNQFPMHIKLEDKLMTKGAVLTQHIRTIDPIVRSVSYIESVSEDFKNHIVKIVGLCFS